MLEINSSLKLLYFVILILLLVIIVYYMKMKCDKKEKLEDNQIYTAGATMRVVGQQFTSTDQGESDIVYNDELRNWNDYKEKMVPLKKTN